MKKTPACRILSKEILDVQQIENNDDDDNIGIDNFSDVLNYCDEDYNDMHADERSKTIIEDITEVAAADHRKSMQRTFSQQKI